MERIAATIPPERLDPVLWYEIKEAKKELSKLQGQTQTKADADGLTLVPAIRNVIGAAKL